MFQGLSNNGDMVGHTMFKRMIGFELVSKETMVSRRWGMGKTRKLALVSVKLPLFLEKGYKANDTSAGLRQRRAIEFKLP